LCVRFLKHSRERLQTNEQEQQQQQIVLVFDVNVLVVHVCVNRLREGIEIESMLCVCVVERLIQKKRGRNV